MKLYLISLLLLFSATYNFSKFYSIKSKLEFYKKIKEFDFSFVCFLKQDDFDSTRIKSVMRSLANSSKFGNNAILNNLNILFVSIDNEDLTNIAIGYGWINNPIFLLLKNNGQVLNIQDFGQHYYIKAMINFIKSSIVHEFEKDQDFDYQADVEDFEVAHRSRNDMIAAGYVPLDVNKDQVDNDNQDQIYFWNRGCGNSSDGRGGLRYHDDCMRKDNHRRKVALRYS